MVSKYLKALALTLLVLAIGVFAINYLDDARAQSISDSVEASALELQASQQLLLYDSVFSDEKACGLLMSRIESQKLQMNRVLAELESAQRNSLFPGSDLVKKRFLLQNIELYLLIVRVQKECAEKVVVPVLYFYPDSYYCADCASQAVALDSVVSKCQTVRVFAFPTDLGIPVIELLKEKHGVTKAPTLVFNNNKYDYLVSEQELLERLGCLQGS